LKEIFGTCVVQCWANIFRQDEVIDEFRSEIEEEIMDNYIDNQYDY
jgi:hypothetical protein